MNPMRTPGPTSRPGTSGLDDPFRIPVPQEVPALSRSRCLSVLRAIEDDMEAALDEARKARAAHCLEALRGLLAPFELGRHEVRICALSDFTCLSVRARSALSDGDARKVDGMPAGGVVLDVLQEIDEFLQEHEEWARLLDGQVLNP